MSKGGLVWAGCGHIAVERDTSTARPIDVPLHRDCLVGVKDMELGCRSRKMSTTCRQHFPPNSGDHITWFVTTCKRHGS